MEMRQTQENLLYYIVVLYDDYILSVQCLL